MSKKQTVSAPKPKVKTQDDTRPYPPKGPKG